MGFPCRVNRLKLFIVFNFFISLKFSIALPCRYNDLIFGYFITEASILVNSLKERSID